jgi:hypothetical protein
MYRAAVRSSAWLGLLCGISLCDELLIFFLCDCPNGPAVAKTSQRPDTGVHQNERGSQMVLLNATDHESHDDEHGKPPRQEAILYDKLPFSFLTHCLPTPEGLWHFFVHGA